MSGIEIFGLIVGAIEIVHTSIEIYDAVKDKSGIPKALRNVSEKLSSVKEILKSVEAQYNEGKLDQQTWANARKDLELCKKLCQELHDFLLDAYPKAGSSSAGRLWKGTTTVLKNKGKSAEALLGEICDHLDNLAKQHIINNTALLEDIKSCLDDLHNTDGVTQSHTGSGHNISGGYNNTGPGHQFNNPSGSIHFGTSKK